MGLDLRSFVVRLDSPPMRAIRSDARAWEEAMDHRPFCDLPSESLPEISRQLQAEFPAGFDRSSPFPDRDHHQAEYLLDPVGFRALDSWPERERSMPYRIIRGDQPFADHATGGQGIGWRCSTAAFLSEAADVIDAIDVPGCRGEFSVAQMYALGVYKVHENDDDDETFDRVLENLRGLARHYRQVAHKGVDLVLTLV